MAAGDVTLTVGTQLSFKNNAAFAPASATTNLEAGTPTDVEISLASVADTAARESAKADLGANRAEWYSVEAAFEFAATPVSGDVVELYWAPSPSGTAANANPMNIDGADAAAPSGIGTLAELVRVCQFIGTFICTDDATTAIQVGHVGVFSPAERYGILIVKNESGAAFHSDNVEIHVVFNPILRNVAA